jgi:PAS domain S-box-containing protein
MLFELTHLIDALPGLAWTALPDGRAEFLNRRWLDYTGLTAEQAVDLGWIEAVHPDDRERVGDYWRSCVISGISADTEARMRRHDGAYRWFRFRASPVRDPAGNISRWFGINFDIEDRKHGEEVLKSSERSLSLILNTIPAHIYVLNTEGAVQYVNQAVMDYTGLSIEDVQQEDYRDRVIHPEDFKRVREPRAAGLRRGQPFSTEQRVLGNDGQYRLFLVRYKPLLDEQGRIVGWYVAAFDIEDRKRAVDAYERQLQRADALAEIDRAKTAFFSNVSHEFRTPLQLILGPLEAVLPEAGERLGPERHQQLLTARRNALRLLKLVNTLLDFSRLEAGRMQAVYQPTDLAGLTSDIASMFRSAMDGAGLQFSVECQPIADTVFVDRGMWEKIVLNLLSNAFKFTFVGEVAISLKVVNGAVELQVRDTGVGIPDDQRGKVFGRFHRIERTSARTHEGTGIGLALVQELVKLHGGRVEVTSAVGVGSTFTVTIPCGKEHLPVEPVHAEPSPPSSDIGAEAYVEEALRWVPDASSAAVDVPMPAKLTSLGSSLEAVLGSERELIVLADDNADMREYLTRLLGERYEVHAVADGRQALEAARQRPPALVLADVMMPQLDGFGLLRAIREDSALCSTPVILVSARAGEESRVEGLQADADDYLVKPFTALELLARVATHVKMAHLRRVTAEREERLRNEAELERQKLDASQELLAQTSRLYRDLAERERESRLIVETIPGFVASLSPAGEVEFVNNRLIEYCGQGLEAMKQWGTNGTVHVDDLPRAIETFTRGITSGEPYDFDARIRRYDGIYRWFQVRGLPLRDLSGQIVRWYSLLVDIDDRKRAETELSALKDQLDKENLVLRDEVDRTSMFEEIIGASATLQPVLSRIAKVARTDSTVLITGETGTGKELVARAIHRRSARASRAFVSVNCAAIPRELIASELFGHEKGAFTGATQRRLGRFELAHGGTIFLDEVGELPMETQVTLLRVLQEREFEHVGGSTSIRVDVRVVAATNRDLQSAIEAGVFRSDLFYRLNVFPIAVPALRERTDDIPLLVEYFIDRYARKAGKTIRRVNKRTLDHLRSYPWPGNVRELQNVIERSVIVCDTDEFTVDESWVSARPTIEGRLALSGTLAAHEKEIIEEALRASGGRVFGPSGAATRLGIPRSTLESKIRALKINKSRFRVRPAKN